MKTSFFLSNHVKTDEVRRENLMRFRTKHLEQPTIPFKAISEPSLIQAFNKILGWCLLQEQPMEFIKQHTSKYSGQLNCVTHKYTNHGIIVS